MVPASRSFLNTEAKDGSDGEAEDSDDERDEDGAAVNVAGLIDDEGASAVDGKAHLRHAAKRRLQEEAAEDEELARAEARYQMLARQGIGSDDGPSEAAQEASEAIAAMKQERRQAALVAERAALAEKRRLEEVAAAKTKAKAAALTALYDVLDEDESPAKGSVPRSGTDASGSSNVRAPMEAPAPPSAPSRSPGSAGGTPADAPASTGGAGRYRIGKKKPRTS